MTTKKTKTEVVGIRPTGYHILVKLQEVKETTAGGIILPDVSKDAEALNIAVGEVIAMGSLAYRDKTTGEFLGQQSSWCAVGDWVICPKFGTKRITLDGALFSLLNDDEIMGVIDDPKRLTAYI